MESTHDQDVNRELKALLSLSKRRYRQDYQRLNELTEQLGTGTPSSTIGDDAAEITVLLAEYESLRQESMNSTNNRVQVLIFGVAAFAALIGGTLTIDRPEDQKLLLWALFTLALPMTCIFVSLVWISEAVRAHRVGAYLAGDVEARINAKLGRLVLSWEAALWTGALPRDERRGPSLIALAAFGFLALSSPLLGVLISKTTWDPVWWPVAQMLPGYALLAGALSYARGLKPRLENSRFVVSVWADRT